MFEARTRPDGSFAIDGLAAGKVILEAEDWRPKRAARAAAARVEAGARDVVIRLR